MKTGFLSRRAVGRLLLWSGAFVLAPPGLADFGRALKERDEVGLRLANLFRSSSAGAIGDEYLRVCPDEADRHRLAGLICSGFTKDVGALPLESLREEIADCIRRDFEADNIVVLEGWFVSRTEARVCAIASLYASSRSAGARA
jgi:hypothetical protein